MLAGPGNMNTRNLPSLDYDNDDVAVYFIVGILPLYAGKQNSILNFYNIYAVQCTHNNNNYSFARVNVHNNIVLYKS